ncbi:MAG TPA: thioredoxin-disulfide reductase [Lactobacillaceae bacterium]|jgi:thioredoxin reductase (NADPH)
MKQYDVIIIGAGPAGMTAATYTSRADLSTLMLDRGIYGGQMMNTADIENYPGFDNVQGPDLAEKMYQSSQQFGAEYGFGTVQSVEDRGAVKYVKTDMDEYEAKAVIIATGAEHVHLGRDGEEAYQGRGVSYCAVCDGAFFRGEDLVVVGGGDSAVEEGMYLTQLAKSVTVVHRREALRAQKILQDRAFKNDKMNFMWNTEVVDVLGDDNKVTGVQVRDVNTGEEQTIDAGGIFIYVGMKPNTAEFQNLPILDEEGWVVTNHKMETAIPGIFAIGDVRGGQLRQVATAVGDGAWAGQYAYEYIAALDAAAVTE